MNKKNLLIGLSGSVAATLYIKIIKRFSEDFNVKTIITPSADKLMTCSSYIKPGNIDIYDSYIDRDEWEDYKYDNSVIHHIDLAKWADIFIICPATANTIAKINHGIADNLLTSTVLAWNKPIYIVPAMNTQMWYNKATQRNIEAITNDGHVIISPTVKKLACGDYGIGALPDINTIVNIVSEHRWFNPFGDRMNLNIPMSPHLGSFGAKRKHDVHTGVDLYCSSGRCVYAVEDSIVISSGPFTGSKLGHTWWYDTDYLMIEGKSGKVLYGEIVTMGQPIGSTIKRGECVGCVKQVLPNNKLRSDIPGHSTSMLHIELYKNEADRVDGVVWEHDTERPKGLIDPTPYLKLL